MCKWTFVLETLNEALSIAKPEIVNSDQSSQFTSNRYTSILLDSSVKISMDGRGRAMDNINPPEEGISIGMKVEVVFRKIYEEEGVIRYGFKFRSV